MRSKAVSALFLFVFVAVSLTCAHGQVVAAGHGRPVHVPVEVGFGGADFSLDWGVDKYGNPHRMNGISAWINTDVPLLSRALKGLALEIEGRDLNYAKPVGLERVRQDTILGGPTYTYRSSFPIRPYAKFMAGMGSLDFPPEPRSTYTHDTRAVMAPGLGVEGRLYGPIWVRGDYEYQFWRKLFGPHTLNPNGYTFGIEFDSRTLHRDQY